MWPNWYWNKEDAKFWKKRHSNLIILEWSIPKFITDYKTNTWSTTVLIKCISKKNDIETSLAGKCIYKMWSKHFTKEKFHIVSNKLQSSQDSFTYSILLAFVKEHYTWFSVRTTANCKNSKYLFRASRGTR